jgi:hypothetical protein
MARPSTQYTIEYSANRWEIVVGNTEPRALDLFIPWRLIEERERQGSLYRLRQPADLHRRSLVTSVRRAHRRDRNQNRQQ